MMAGSLVLGSWMMTTFVLASRNPSEFYLSYFLFDFIAAEVVAFMILHRSAPWLLVFFFSLIAQLLVHVWFWGPTMPPRRYHEILNFFYVIQMSSVLMHLRHLWLRQTLLNNQRLVEIFQQQ